VAAGGEGDPPRGARWALGAPTCLLAIFGKCSRIAVTKRKIASGPVAVLLHPYGASEEER